MLAATIAHERFEPICRRHTQIIQIARLMQHIEFSQRLLFNAAETLSRRRPSTGFRSRDRETSGSLATIIPQSRYTSNVQRKAAQRFTRAATAVITRPWHSPNQCQETATPLTDPETGGTLTIDLDAIEANWRTLARKLLTVECGAVVKANAYGLGLEPVTAKLAKAGCKTFFVADIAEARRARTRARDATIYVLNGFAVDAGMAFVELNVQPVINSTAELAEWDAFVSAQNWRGGAAIHVDTGMNRLGISADEAAALALRLQQENHGITLLMSHLACAEIADHPLTAAQIRLFRELRMLYHGVPASLANSAGIFIGDTAHFDLARPGAALYGINPTPGRANPMRHVVELTGRILQVRKVPQGGTVGYGAAWTARRASRIAVVGAWLCRRLAAGRQQPRSQKRRHRDRRGEKLPDRRLHFDGHRLCRRH